MSARILGLDVGDKRIGMAVSDELRITAQPLELYERRGPRQDVAFIAGKLQELEAEVLVVGIPYKMSGGMSAMAERIKAFADKLQEVISAKIVVWDERMTTVAANRAMLEGDLSRKKRKAKIDVVAAQLILQGYLDSLAFKQEQQEQEERWRDA